MSGLAGWVDFARDLRTRQHAFAAMVRAMRDRGPDDERVWVSAEACFGHRRLAVPGEAGGIHLFSKNFGEQNVVAMYAGRLFNAAELKSALIAMGAPFEAESDAETLLWAYLQWGVSFVERVDGMFGIAIWDGRKEELLLARDRLGVKPLYYAEYPSGILFSSEPKGIMANGLFEPRLNYWALPIVLQPRLAIPGETPLVGLREVIPAHVVVFSRDGARLAPYWQLVACRHEDSWDETVGRTRALLQRAVRSQMIGQAPFGAMLSGGLDSTSVTALASKNLGSSGSGALNTFCVQFSTDASHFKASELRPEVDAPFAQAAAAHLGTVHHTITANAAELDEILPVTRRARDLPAWGQFDASMHLLFRAMRTVSKIAFTGEVADELFGGYPYFFKDDVLEREQFPWLGDAPRLADCLSADVKKRADPAEGERTRYAELMAQVPRLPGEPAHDARIREALFLSMKGPLAVILDRKDRMSSAAGLEVRAPFCDHELVQYVWNVPWRLKTKGGVKGLLKAAMADFLPADTVKRKKSAYPHIQDPSYEQSLFAQADRIASDEGSTVGLLFDQGRLGAWIESLKFGAQAKKTFPGGASPAFALIHLIEFERWVEEYGVSLR